MLQATFMCAIVYFYVMAIFSHGFFPRCRVGMNKMYDGTCVRLFACGATA